MQNLPGSPYRCFYLLNSLQGTLLEEGRPPAGVDRLLGLQLQVVVREGSVQEQGLLQEDTLQVLAQHQGGRQGLPLLGHGGLVEVELLLGHHDDGAQQ
jgi:hypothetical protein